MIDIILLCGAAGVLAAIICELIAPRKPRTYTMDEAMSEANAEMHEWEASKR